MFHIVLIEPEIPNNTGNIGRTCVGTNATLHLVGPLGFEISDSKLKRAGLDYWPHLNYKIYDSYQEWKDQVSHWERVFFMSRKAPKSLYEEHFLPGDVFVFGKESKGLDPEIIRDNYDRCLSIPQVGPIRSLNLGTAVAVVNYEALRQVNFASSAAGKGTS